MHEHVDYNKEILDALQAQNTLLAEIHDTLMGSFVQQTRLYDVFAAIGAGATEDGISALIAAHEQGEIDTAPPLLQSWAGGLEDDDEE